MRAFPPLPPIRSVLSATAKLLTLTPPRPSDSFRQAFMLLGRGARYAAPSTTSALLPLMAESYLTYFATTRSGRSVTRLFTYAPCY